MTRSLVGMVLGVTAASLATWWFTRRDMAREMSNIGRGEVIFHNHPAV